VHPSKLTSLNLTEVIRKIKMLMYSRSRTQVPISDSLPLRYRARDAVSEATEARPDGMNLLYPALSCALL
jgi:hypothetical protein